MRAKVKGIGICKLDLQEGRIIYLHDVLYTIDIWWNLVYVLALLNFGYSLYLLGECVNYGYRYIMDGFIVLNIKYCNSTLNIL